jgi:hypothetical protein
LNSARNLVAKHVVLHDQRDGDAQQLAVAWERRKTVSTRNATNHVVTTNLIW